MTNQFPDLGLTDAKTSGGSCCGGGACMCGHGGAAHGSADTAAATVSTQVLVDGMTCGHCVSSVTEELSEIGGVANVAVELNAGGSSMVTIASEQPLAAADVRAAIEDAGYRVATAV